jgi:hypothetical protein
LSWKSDAKLGEAPHNPHVKVKVVTTITITLLLDFFFHGQFRHVSRNKCVWSSFALLLNLKKKSNFEIVSYKWWRWFLYFVFTLLINNPRGGPYLDFQFF